MGQAAVDARTFTSHQFFDTHKNRMYTYPVVLKTLGNGDVMVTFPDVPEAITYGDTPALALEWAQDALHVALLGYMDDHRDIPPASAPKPGQPTVQAAGMGTAYTVQPC